MIKKQLAESLIQKELSLNEQGLREVGIPMGSLMVYIWREKFYRNRYTSASELATISIVRLLKYFISIFFKQKRKIGNKPIHLVIGRTANTPHCEALIGALRDENNSDILINGNLDSLNQYLRPKSRLRIIIKTMLKSKYIFNVIKDLNSKRKWRLFMQLSIMITRYYVSELFIKVVKPKVVIVDYDRGVFAPLVMAARKTSVKTITLQHGAINPPYGYTPLLADEIWVWGKGWGSILQDLTVNKYRIRITGTPIIDKLMPYEGDNRLRRIGVGPNPVSDDENERVWMPIIEKLLKKGFEVIVKLHPAQKKDSYIGKMFTDLCSTFEAKEITNEKFFHSIDLLFVSTSGLGYESVCAGVPVMVVPSSVNSTANDWIMTEKIGFPKVNEENLERIMNTYEYHLSKLHSLEMNGLKNFGYERIGFDSAQLMKRQLNLALNE